MKRNSTTLYSLAAFVAAAALNCLTDGTLNLIITIALCLVLIPLGTWLDREARREEQHEEE